MIVRWSKEPEKTEFMADIIPGHSEAEIRTAFKDKYGIVLTKAQIKGFKSWRDIKSGTVGGQFQKGNVSHNKGKKMSAEQYEKCKGTMFKKGNVPVNHKPIGSERITDGYVMIKVAEPNKWRLKQRVVWEEYYGEKLGKNDVIVFIDNNPLNFDISNLSKLTRAELARLNSDNLRNGNAEVGKVAISIAKIKARAHKRANTNDGKWSSYRKVVIEDDS